MTTTSSSSSTTSPTTSSTVSLASADRPDPQEFAAAVEVLHDFGAEWNAANLEWVTAYADDTIPFDEYMEVSYETELAQRKLIAHLTVESGRFPDEMSSGVKALVQNYQGRADAFHRIVEAEVAADDDAWRAAMDEYYASSAPDAVMPILRDIMSTPTIEALLVEEGINVDEFVEAMASAFGAG